MSNSFYCAAPWRGLHVNPRGDVKTCCAGNPNMLGNLNNQSIEQILNSAKEIVKENDLKLENSESEGSIKSFERLANTTEKLALYKLLSKLGIPELID